MFAGSCHHSGCQAGCRALAYGCLGVWQVDARRNLGCLGGWGVLLVSSSGDSSLRVLWGKLWAREPNRDANGTFCVGQPFRAWARDWLHLPGVLEIARARVNVHKRRLPDEKVFMHHRPWRSPNHPQCDAVQVPGQGWGQIVAFLGCYELFINKPAIGLGCRVLDSF